MSVAEKAELRRLPRKAGRRIELVKYVTPTIWIFQRSVDDRKTVNFRRERQHSQPLFLLTIELIARPLDGDLGQRIETFQRAFRRRIIVVISFHDRTV